MPDYAMGNEKAPPHAAEGPSQVNRYLMQERKNGCGIVRCRVDGACAATTPQHGHRDCKAGAKSFLSHGNGTFRVCPPRRAHPLRGKRPRDIALFLRISLRCFIVKNVHCIALNRVRMRRNEKRWSTEFDASRHRITCHAFPLFCSPFGPRFPATGERTGGWKRVLTLCHLWPKITFDFPRCISQGGLRE